MDNYENKALENNDYKFIFGILAYWPQPNSEPNLYTMNDFEVFYDKEDKKYKYSVETLLGFKEKCGAIKYMNNILDQFTEWMKLNGYDTTKELDLYEAFTDPIRTDFDTLEELYATFKLIVRGFNGEGILV